MVKVAVATSDGITINEHFGQAREFRIYAVEDDGSYQELEVRSIKSAPLEPPRAHAADTTVEQLVDVGAVLVSQIGPSAVTSLTERGIRSFTVRGGVAPALAAYGKRRHLLEHDIPGVSECSPKQGGCGCSQRGCK
jgi:nitrogen fixation protein NifB